jgi:PIN domain nuclease of toxin-antitoxin system
MVSSPCVVSVASIWEVDLKHRLGKLPIAPRRFRDEMRSAGAIILSVTDEHVFLEPQVRSSIRVIPARPVASNSDICNAPPAASF